MKKILLGFGFLMLVFSTFFVQQSNMENKKELIKFSKGKNIFDVQQRGCCSWHGGVDGCSGGRVVCSDGSLSPSCTCNSNIDPLAGCSI